MALTTVKSIEQALNLVDTKKESLKKAFEELQSHSSLLSSLHFTWPDLDSYFTSFQSELLHKFSTLEAVESSETRKSTKPEKRKDSFLSEPVPARPELKSLCENMDGLGLRKYVIDRPKERSAIRVELVDAFKQASDPGSVILDALEGFWDEKLGPGSKLRTGCVVLLEELMRAGVKIASEVRERAKAIAVEWKEKIAAAAGGGNEEERALERLCYLQLLATYKLSDDAGYDVNELIDYVVLSARYRQAAPLCRILGLESKISDVIPRLINKGKQLSALKFIFEFELMDEFPPVPLLKSYVMDSTKNAQKVHKSGRSTRRSLNEAVMKEINALKSVVKCIEDYGLESQYPRDELVRRIENLEKEKADRKRPLPKPQQQQAKETQRNGGKRMKTATGPSAFKRKLAANSAVPPSQPRAGLLPDHAASYLNSSAGAYGMPVVAAVPYVGSSVDLYGLSGAPLGYSGNLNPSVSNPYPPSETHAQPGFCDRAINYGGYELPSQYHPAYYPQ
ncbi:hypothetical protein CDL12_01087 [Handroanthus impetiginosus]|uniref:FRIGIDA-like protein n=1 Tax=Handroanthus impetiginosus TaxID=429701 RepID=A0A2G9I8T5_9LAMI|nr:hypothetical protein CDL12_01087 [Handroanthus impetiginosus]